MLKYRPAFLLSLFSLLISFVRSAFFPAINVVSSAYLKLFSVLPAIFTPSFASSISALLIILSAYRLNKNGDKMQPCLTPFLILNLSVSPNSVLITAAFLVGQFIYLQNKIYKCTMYFFHTKLLTIEPLSVLQCCLVNLVCFRVKDAAEERKSKKRKKERTDDQNNDDEDSHSKPSKLKNNKRKRNEEKHTQNEEKNEEKTRTAT